MAESLKLPVEGAPFPKNFKGDPQEFFEAMIDRLRVVFPTGQTSFVISDTEPSSNQGPWLKDGTQWYVWDEDSKRYVPLDISPSVTAVYTISATAPTNGNDVPIWIRYRGTRGIGVYLWLGGAWKPLFPASGDTASRPAMPLDGERYLDTEIGTEIYWSQSDSEWKTVSGSKGDTKYVVYGTLTEALTHNPGWQEFGQYMSDNAVRGRAFVPAHTDDGASPVTDLGAGVGITKRASQEQFGEEEHSLTTDELPAHDHDILQYDPAGTLVPAPIISAFRQTSGSNPLSMTDNTYPATGFDSVVGPEGGNSPHNVLGPRLALWCLVKK